MKRNFLKIGKSAITRIVGNVVPEVKAGGGFAPPSKKALQKMKDDYIATAQFNSRRLKLAHAKNESIMLNKAVGTMNKRRAATKGYFKASLTEGSGLSVVTPNNKKK